MLGTCARISLMASHLSALQRNESWRGKQGKMSEELIDCLVIGAGPAGLAAAIYLGRFRRRFVVVDAGRSRARHIPLSHNYPGFSEGVTGADLLARMTRQACSYGATIVSATVTKVERSSEGAFHAAAEDRAFRARSILLTTGVVDEQPAVPDLDQAVGRGLLRYCPVCDGFEAIGRHVAVVGYGAEGLTEALFLRTYTSDITLLTLGQPMQLTSAQQRQLHDAGIRVIEDPVREVAIADDRIQALTMRDGATHMFDVLYSALGTAPRSELARQLGAAQDEKSCIVVDQHQRTSVEDVYAAGDVVQGLDQIAVAIGQAAIAACAIHNRLNQGA
jgi:thioredoxin reductase (NADPH)